MAEIFRLIRDCKDAVEDVRDMERQYKGDPCADVVFQISDMPDYYESSLSYLAHQLDSYGGVNCKIDSRVQTPLMSAASAGIGPVIKLLLEHGARVNDLSSSNQTALDYANDECKAVENRAESDFGTPKEQLRKECQENIEMIAQAGGKTGAGPK